MTEENALVRQAPEFLQSKGISGRTAKLLIGSPDEPSQFTAGFGLGIGKKGTGYFSVEAELGAAGFPETLKSK